jgi:hypothetical protein
MEPCPTIEDFLVEDVYTNPSFKLDNQIANAEKLLKIQFTEEKIPERKKPKKIVIPRTIMGDVKTLGEWQVKLRNDMRNERRRRRNNTRNKSNKNQLNN